MHASTYMGIYFPFIMSLSLENFPKIFSPLYIANCLRKCSLVIRTHGLDLYFQLEYPAHINFIISDKNIITRQPIFAFLFLHKSQDILVAFEIFDCI